MLNLVIVDRLLKKWYSKKSLNYFNIINNVKIAIALLTKIVIFYKKLFII